SLLDVVHAGPGYISGETTAAWIVTSGSGQLRCRIGRQADDQFAEIAPFEQANERLRRRVKTVDDVVAILQAAVADERCTLLRECRLSIGVVADDEAFDHRAVYEQRSEVGAAAILLGRVVLRDQSAQRNPRAAS